MSPISLDVERGTLSKGRYVVTSGTDQGSARDVTSEPGEGSTLDAWLPAVEETVAPKATRTAVSNKGTGKVLVMDDEDSIRTILSEMLGMSGYEVKLSENGEQALELFSEALRFKQPFDLVILDLIIPNGMGGQETAGKLRELDTAVPILVSSGYSNNPVMSRYRDFGFTAVLPKPYRMLDMLNTIAQLIADRK